MIDIDTKQNANWLKKRLLDIDASRENVGWLRNSDLVTHGGEGSGDYGHAGRPKEVGGSGPRNFFQQYLADLHLTDEVLDVLAEYFPYEKHVPLQWRGDRGLFPEYMESSVKIAGMQEVGWSMRAVDPNKLKSFLAFAERQESYDDPLRGESLAEDVVDFLFRSWARNPQGPITDVLKHRAMMLFNLPYSAPHEIMSPAFSEDHKEVLNAFLNAVHKRTQEKIKDWPEEVVFYRGFGYAEGKEGTFKEGYSKRLITTRPISSFSTSYNTAVGFGDRSSSIPLFGDMAGSVIEVRVPKKDIFSVPGVGFGCLFENEAVIIGRERMVKQWVGLFGTPVPTKAEFLKSKSPKGNRPVTNEEPLDLDEEPENANWLAGKDHSWDLPWIRIVTHGGEGSGNYGHAGRPKEVGGSGPRDALRQNLENLHLTDEVLEILAEYFPDKGPVSVQWQKGTDNGWFEPHMESSVKIAGVREVGWAMKDVDPKKLESFLAFAKRETGVSPRGDNSAEAVVDLIYYSWASEPNNFIVDVLKHRAMMLFDLPHSKSYDFLIEARSESHEEVLNAFLNAVYKRTQDKIKDWPEEVTLYRGFIYQRGSFDRGYAERLITTRPLSSFSSSYDTASVFGNVENEVGSMIEMRVPKKDIFSVPGVGFGCLNEGEVVVIGRDRMAKQWIGPGGMIPTKAEFSKSKSPKGNRPVTNEEPLDLDEEPENANWLAGKDHSWDLPWIRIVTHGGEGSGNYGHAGRSGQVGGSGKGNTFHANFNVRKRVGDVDKFLKLVGDPHDAEIHFHEVLGGDIKVTILHADYKASRRVNIRNKTIINESIESFKRDAGKQSFAQQVKEATEQGYRYIDIDASRSKTAIGYSFWPLMGYDGPIDIPGRSERTMQELYRTEEGRKWWKENGGPVLLRFDLTSGSLSHRILEKYLQKKNIVAHGGAGSGNYGHAGRSGQVGGSARSKSNHVEVIDPEVYRYNMSEEDILKLAGDPEGAEVRFRIKSVYDGNARLSDAIEVSIQHADYTAERLIEPEKKFIHNQYFFSFKKDAGKQLFAQQVKEATKQGYRYIDMIASRGEGMIGYSFWPLMGYDSPIKIPGRPERTIQELYRTEEGREWWKKNGASLDLRFDLTPWSLSHRVLEKYLQKKGIVTH